MKKNIKTLRYYKGEIIITVIIDKEIEFYISFKNTGNLNFVCGMERKPEHEKFNFIKEIIENNIHDWFYFLLKEEK